LDQIQESLLRSGRRIREARAAGRIRHCQIRIQITARRDVPYFNGGIFDVVEPVELKITELELLIEAATQNWSRVNPAIFGTIFQGSMGKKERHALGAHFTSEADIQKVVRPTIIRPWRERINAAKNDKELLELRKELHEYRVLDSACGSGNFLYVAYREMYRLEWELVDRLGPVARAKAVQESVVGSLQFFGIDIISFAVELAKVTLMLAKKLALDERQQHLEEIHFAFDMTERPLPLANLNANITCADALFCDWPRADAIISNPPYQSKNKMQQEFGPDYVRKVRAQYPSVPGRADYCVYWFRRAHDELAPGGRAGLVGTNTIRQNYSREGGLDYIIDHGGTITEAVSTQVWSGEAAVHVSIVNWIKGEAKGKKKLITQKGDNRDSPWEVVERDVINSALSVSIDVSAAVRLQKNIDSGACYQGQTHGHKGFLLSEKKATELVKKDEQNRKVIFPYLTADEMLGIIGSIPVRSVIDFQPRDVMAARAFKDVFAYVETAVLPTRKDAAKKEAERNKKILDADADAKVNHHHQNFLNQWWLLSYGREKMIHKIATLPRYIVCGRVTKRPVFEFLSSGIRPNDALQVFAFVDDYSFGILQSGIHWAWFVAKCSTLKGDFRYTSDSVFDTFPWPQSPTLTQALHVAEAAVQLRQLRRKVMTDNKWSLRDLYRTLEAPGKNSLRDAQNALDSAVREAYGMKANADPLVFLLELNRELAVRERVATPIIGPGLPPCAKNATGFVTTDCVQPPRLA
jgi:SAM-dependent methyltransferase